MSARSVLVTAPGKVNICLGVGEKRADGYHDVATVYQAVSLVDDVTATDATGFSVSFSGPIDTASLDTGSDNLVIRAAHAVADATGYTGGAHLDVVKRIPIAGGMGGGSADAAATLVAVNELWRTGLSVKELHALAAGLGADVPFALHGGTAIGVGRGDELSPVLSTGHFEWVLVPSPAGLSTPTVFRELDRYRDTAVIRGETPSTNNVVRPELLHALRAGDAHALAGQLYNDLQDSALILKPELGAVLEFGETSGALAGIVSGSGPTVAFLMADGESALDLVDRFTRNGRPAWRAMSPVPGARVQ